jgi:hypothetical protein
VEDQSFKSKGFSPDYSANSTDPASAPYRLQRHGKSLLAMMVELVTENHVRKRDYNKEKFLHPQERRACSAR